jgi:hypothetical protein
VSLSNHFIVILATFSTGAGFLEAMAFGFSRAGRSIRFGGGEWASKV